MKLLRTTLILALSVTLLGSSVPVAAGTTYPPDQKSGAIGLEGRISAPPPKRGATITTPGNGATFTSLPITVTGLCPDNLLVKLFSNNVFVGAVMCNKGSYSIQIDLFAGQNQLVARVYDDLDQAGPDSNTVTVTYVSAQFAVTGNQFFLTSNFAKRGANPGEELIWPIIITGGVGPYALSVDWGDNSAPQVLSSSTPGSVDIKHVYKRAGIYKIVVTGTDSRGQVAILQLVGVANGAGQQNVANSAAGGTSVTRVIVLWWPAVAMLPLVIASFWVGQRHELYVLRKRLEKSRDREAA